MNGTIITTKGIELITKLIASGTVLTFTRMAVGTGQIPMGFDPAGMIGLNNYKIDGNIASVETSGDTASVVCQISSIKIAKSFTITEAGIFAMDPDEGEILYAYLDLSHDQQHIYAEGDSTAKFVEITLNVVVGQVNSVSATINVSSLVTKEVLDRKLGDLKENLNTKLWSYCSDVFSLGVLKSDYKIVTTDGNTLNTPFKYGLTICTGGVCLCSPYGTMHCTLNFIPVGSNVIFSITKNSLGWGSWKAIAGESPVRLTTTDITQSAYRIELLQVTKHDGWCRVYCHLIPTGTGTQTLVELASGLPIPVAIASTWCPPANNMSGTSIGVNVNGSGVLTARYGIANGIYQANFMYPYAI